MHPDHIERARREGHRVCNHTATHAHLSDLPDERIAAEIVGGAGHGECDLLRPPAMATSARVERVAASLGYRMYLWHVDSRDWERKGVDSIVAASTPANGAGGAILMHDAGGDRSETVAALDRLIPELKAQGYTFTTVSKGVGLPPADQPASGFSR